MTAKTRARKQAAQEWNRGLVGAALRPRLVTRPGECTTDGCGAVTGYGATRSVTCCLVRLQARIIDLADHQPDAVSVSTDTQDGAL